MRPSSNDAKHDPRLSMNIGAQAAETTEYKDVSNITVKSISANEMAMRAVNDAIEWANERGNAGDNIPMDKLTAMATALDATENETALRHAFEIAGTQMHPTANDIVGGAARQVVYSLTGRRAHTFEVDQ